MELHICASPAPRSSSLNTWMTQHSESDHDVALSMFIFMISGFTPSLKYYIIELLKLVFSKPQCEFGYILGSCISCQLFPLAIYQFGNEFHGSFSFVPTWGYTPWRHVEEVDAE